MATCTMLSQTLKKCRMEAPNGSFTLLIRSRFPLSVENLYDLSKEPDPYFSSATTSSSAILEMYNTAVHRHYGLNIPMAAACSLWL